ncbi:Transposon Tf2-8 polyprotein [Stylophora pistillata]|uniref:Transposon Tf2-8 polyprotein n=1 Tax=Stylophora pistillata TaxID=50429 RepID=A0A2B4R6S2_STYPI|nr:Transposon Tf2-8 polyprotein [Stylophora pistillata]
MKKLDDIAAVQRLMGMVKYLSKFRSDLSQICEPISSLTHKGEPWFWTKEQDVAFDKIKEAVTSAPVLKYFDSSKPTEGSGDAASLGLGFVLTQEDHPLIYASRALTQAEQRYSQIEKELLAQVFGLEHNHQKPLAATSKRLQRLLRLQQYDAEIRYRPGREMYLADALSRAYLTQSFLGTQRSETQKEVESIHAVDYLAISEQQLSEIKQETAKDPTLQTLKNAILRGWPENSSSTPKEVSEYFNVRDELAVQDGIIFKGQRCVSPKTLRQKVKEKIHRAHIGIQGCLRRAREVVYWPSMNQEIIEHCDTCNMYTSHPQREPLIVHDVHERPWQKVGCDLFTLDEKDFLCTIDYYSDYFEIEHLERKTARAIITRLKRHFSNHGIPNLFQSDNGPPFDSQEFRDFAAAYEFELVTSSPNHPQSNGRIENGIKTAKQLMKKSKQAETDFYLTLLDWRNTPTEGVGCSPVQRLCGQERFFQQQQVFLNLR